MGTQVTFTCDRCKKVLASEDALWEVALTCESRNGYRSHYFTPTKQQKAEWCRPCVDEMGVFVGLIRAETPEQPPTIENIIREIVREEQSRE